MKVACVLITHLPMKAELGRHPDLQGRPVIITESRGVPTSRDAPRRLVLDSSPEVRGITPGMPLQEALSRCKDTVLLEADRPYYQSAFDAVLRSLEQRSPLVERAGLGCAYVGLDGLEALYRGEARLITALLQAVPYTFNPRIGVATGKFPAYVAAVTSSGGQATRAPEDVAGFLKDFSIDLLPLSWEAVNRLHRFGLHTLGQLAALPVGSIQAQLGVEGRRAWELSNGVDPSPLLPYRREEVVSESLTFPSPTVTLDALLAAVETLLSRAFARPEVRGRYIRSVTIESGVVGHPPWTRHFVFKEAVNGKERAFFILKGMIGVHCADSVEHPGQSRPDSIEGDTRQSRCRGNTPLPGPLEDMKLTLAGLTGESGIQTSLFSDIRRREQLREMMQQLEALLGSKPPIYQVREIEPWSRIPERRQALVPFDP